MFPVKGGECACCLERAYEGEGHITNILSFNKHCMYLESTA